MLGWDIDSRIDLVRGADGEKESQVAPCKMGELIAWKAEQNPELNIYLLRWDYSTFFLSEREPMAALAWQARTPPNVHSKLDDTMPMGGSHHQKIVIVDDEVAFIGGMDVALFRYDHRDHRMPHDCRVDPKGEFGPLHDVHLVMDGPIVRDLSEHCRKRWMNAVEYEIEPALKSRVEEPYKKELSYCWPNFAEPLFINAEWAIARTFPHMKGYEEIREIEQLFLDEIGLAEKFIYLENQFFARENIAVKINEQMRLKPDLRVLCVSSYDPRGFFERRAMWNRRLKFANIVTAGIDPKRFAMTYPVVKCDDGSEKDIRIHAKLSIIDDKVFRVGSANISSRSMTLDTEIDVAIHADTQEHRENVAFIRNDLIREHTGREYAEIQDWVDNGGLLPELLEPVSYSTQTLKYAEDKKFVAKSMQILGVAMGDPEMPLMPEKIREVARAFIPYHMSKRLLGFSVILMALILAMVYAGAEMIQGSAVTEASLEELLTQASYSNAGFFVAVGVMILGSLIFFPITVMIAACAAVFGPWFGFVYAMIGALSGAVAGFFIGRSVGENYLHKFMGARLNAIDYKIRDSGIIGVTLFRMVPVAPYTLVNYTAGVTSIRFTDYVIGTFLGLFPGSLVLAFMGDKIADTVAQPTPENISLMGAGIAVWCFVVWATNRIVQQVRSRQKAQQVAARQTNR